MAEAARVTSPVSGGMSWKPALHGVIDYIGEKTYEIARCSGCGVMRTCLEPGDTEIQQHYPPRYRGRRQLYTGAWRARRRASMVERCFAGGFTGKILDIGCGNG